MGADTGKSLDIVITEKSGGDTLVSTNDSETKKIGINRVSLPL
jgi:hypothetical protein